MRASGGPSFTTGAAGARKARASGSSSPLRQCGPARRVDGVRRGAGGIGLGVSFAGRRPSDPRRRRSAPRIAGRRGVGMGSHRRSHGLSRHTHRPAFRSAGETAVGPGAAPADLAWRAISGARRPTVGTGAEPGNAESRWQRATPHRRVSPQTGSHGSRRARRSRLGAWPTVLGIARSRRPSAPRQLHVARRLRGRTRRHPSRRSVGTEPVAPPARSARESPQTASRRLRLRARDGNESADRRFPASLTRHAARAGSTAGEHEAGAIPEKRVVDSKGLGLRRRTPDPATRTRERRLGAPEVRHRDDVRLEHVLEGVVKRCLDAVARR